MQIQLIESRIKYIAIVVSDGTPASESKIIPKPSLIPKPFGVIGIMLTINVIVVIMTALKKLKLYPNDKNIIIIINPLRIGLNKVIKIFNKIAFFWF